MKTLSIDIETYSNQNLAKTGVYRYVESPAFEILLFSYSVDGDPVQLVDLACGEKIPTDIVTKGTIDNRIMKALSQKEHTQTALIDAVKADLKI